MTGYDYHKKNLKVVGSAVAVIKSIKHLLIHAELSTLPPMLSWNQNLFPILFIY